MQPSRESHFPKQSSLTQKNSATGRSASMAAIASRSAAVASRSARSRREPLRGPREPLRGRRAGLARAAPRTPHPHGGPPAPTHFGSTFRMRAWRLARPLRPPPVCRVACILNSLTSRRSRKKQFSHSLQAKLSRLARLRGLGARARGLASALGGHAGVCVPGAGVPGVGARGGGRRVWSPVSASRQRGCARLGGRQKAG